jgi:hypothetical protein
MRDMLGGSYTRALRSSFYPEWVSMNCVMAGMVPVMVILRAHLPGTTDVGNVRFWAVLSLAVFAGLVLAYPVNVWLVDKKLKHGMGTVRALGDGGEPLPEGSGGGGHEEMDMSKPEVTRPELVAIAALTILLLTAGVLVAAIAGSFT